MTTAAQHRCVHCKSPYIFHPSFYGGDEVNYPHNHHEYCPDCYKVVKWALSKVPVRYEKRWLPANEYTKDQIVKHQEDRCATGLPVRRTMAPLFDMTGNARNHIVCECMPDGEWYMAEWWSNEPDKVKVTKEVWCKIEKKS